MTKLSSLLKKEAVSMQSLDPLFLALRKARKYSMRSYRLNQIETAYNNAENMLQESREHYQNMLPNEEDIDADQDIRPIPY